MQEKKANVKPKRDSARHASSLEDSDGKKNTAWAKAVPVLGQRKGKHQDLVAVLGILPMECYDATRLKRVQRQTLSL